MKSQYAQKSVVDESRYVQVVYNRNTKRFFARNAEGKEYFKDFVVRVIWLKLRGRLQ